MDKFDNWRRAPSHQILLHSELPIISPSSAAHCWQSDILRSSAEFAASSAPGITAKANYLDGQLAILTVIKQGQQHTRAKHGQVCICLLLGHGFECRLSSGPCELGPVLQQLHASPTLQPKNMLCRRLESQNVSSRDARICRGGKAEFLGKWIQL